MTQSVRCPSCYQSGARLVDQIPPAYEFAGRVLAQPLQGGALYRCRACELCFRYPRLSKKELDKLYAAGACDNWQSSPLKRPDWSIAADLIRAEPQVKSVIDIGCFDGRFLEYLGPDYARSGIEIHREAAEAAKRRGITLVGHNFDALDVLTERYDCVFAFDVIEHVEDPKAFLAALRKITKPGGLIVISTGNADALSWKLMRGMYWYCTIPEHIAFVSPNWCQRIARSIGLNVRHVQLFSHEPLPMWSALAHAAANILYRCSPKLGFRLRCLYAKFKDTTAAAWYAMPPPWRCARDHFIVLFRNEQTSI